MRSLMMTAMMCGLAMATGCANISGTWKMAPGQTPGNVSFGSMTLADDGTFTAEAKYGNQTRVVSGFYKFCTMGCSCDGCTACKGCKAGCAKDCCSKNCGAGCAKACCSDKCAAGCKKSCCTGKAGCICFESDGQMRSYKARLAADTLTIMHEGEKVTMNRLRR